MADNLAYSGVSMFSNLKLIHKGLGLVGILLALELVFVASLSVLLDETEKAAIREEHSKKIVGRTNRIMQLLYDAGQMASDYQDRDGDPESARLYHEDMKKIPVEFAELKKLVEDKPDYAKRVAKIERTSKSGLNLVANCMALIEGGNKLAALPLAQQNRENYKNFKKTIFEDLRNLMQDQQKVVDEIPAFQAKYREQQKLMLHAGLLANIFIAIVLGLFFVKTITRRLDVMVTNTNLFARNQSLLPLMGGRDEIATLDSSFHKMARTLKDLEDRKQQFVSMVSHDLRSPLTSLRMFLELVHDGVYGELNASGQKRAKIAERSIIRLIALINDLLDFDRLQSGQLEIVKRDEPVESVITRSLDAVSALAEQNKIKLQSEGAEFNAIMDGDRIIQVLVNLISNAVKFSPEGSTVTVRALPKDGNVEFFVIDQGRGIPKEMLTAVFERFKQVTKTDATEKGGTGLGLAICKAIVECHGGQIGVDSEVGKGTTFWFTLPNACAAIERKPETVNANQ